MFYAAKTVLTVNQMIQNKISYLMTLTETHLICSDRHYAIMQFRSIAWRCLSVLSS